MKNKNKRLFALIKKESLQIIRDPSALMIAFALPFLLLFIYGNGLNLDSNKVRIGILVEEQTPDVLSLVTAFTNSKFFDAEIGRSRENFENELMKGKIRGMVVIPQDFSRKSLLEENSPHIQVIADGTEPNIAAFVQNYSSAVVQIWLIHQQEDDGILEIKKPLITVDTRFWYNPELRSKNFLIPGSIAIIMSLIGILLTALVISREWERGTMEALLVTPISGKEILIGKVIPYFVLGICSMSLCFIVAVFIYEVPFRGSFLSLLLVGSVFLIAALSQGLFISTTSRDQFIAAQSALVSGFLPAFMLSGFLFEITSMPYPIQILTHIFSVRYFVTSLQTLFLVGNVWTVLFKCIGAMLVIIFVLLFIILRKTAKRLD